MQLADWSNLAPPRQWAGPAPEVNQTFDVGVAVPPTCHKQRS
jgi:hypothetical protein